jgi:transcriptional regulator GlxA family with amidase domain
MKNIAIIVPDHGSADGVFDASIFFTWVNYYLNSIGEVPLQVQMIGKSKKIKLNNGTFTVNGDTIIKQANKQFDLILIPSIAGDFKELINRNKKFFPWIVEQHQGGAEVASLCLGVFLLASTGLLNGKQCPVHWFAANEFREMFPEVEVVDDKIITQQQGIYSSASGVSHWNLLLHFLEKFVNREAAIAASKFFAVDINRDSQLPFVIFNGKKNHNDEPIKDAQNFIEKNFTSKLSIDDLAIKFAIGRRHFERRFKKATNNTPVEYIQRVKIEAAKRQLETGKKNVNEVMYDVGYNDKQAFRTVFQKIAGMTPSEYRKKFNQESITI